ncbi:hypothetical protein TIFTF001_019446 [Ficus carica]|uniref:SAM domain-containing protein n=1 Tax=Ficus carica TaxID=3494 RepID=A0AA88DCQ2_FICCA|nr:hypothetical protein TIFTF001_019446 [Ficus carica]
MRETSLSRGAAWPAPQQIRCRRRSRRPSPSLPPPCRCHDLGPAPRRHLELCLPPSFLPHVNPLPPARSRFYDPHSLHSTTAPDLLSFPLSSSPLLPTPHHPHPPSLLSLSKILRQKYYYSFSSLVSLQSDPEASLSSAADFDSFLSLSLSPIRVLFFAFSFARDSAVRVFISSPFAARFPFPRRVEAETRRSIKDRLNGNFRDDASGRRQVIGKRQRQDDKWEHDLYQDDEPQLSNRKIDARDLRLKLQRKSHQASVSGRGSQSGVRDLREKLSGTMHPQPVNYDPPKLKQEASKPARKSVAIQASATESRKASTSVDDFLQSLGLEKYSITFQAEEVDMAALAHMTDEDLKAIGIPMVNSLNFL